MVALDAWFVSLLWVFVSCCFGCLLLRCLLLCGCYLVVASCGMVVLALCGCGSCVGVNDC